MKKLDTGNRLMFSFDDIRLSDVELESVVALAYAMFYSNTSLLNAWSNIEDEEESENFAKEIFGMIQRAICAGISYGRNPLEEDDLKAFIKDIRKGMEQKDAERADNPPKKTPTAFS